MRDAAFCFHHNPETEEQAAEARRLGGIRRRREKALSGAYDVGALDSVGSLRRLLEIAAYDALGLDNSIARARVLISVALAGAKLLEIGDLEERLAAIEHALRTSAPSQFDDIDDDDAA